MKFLMLITMFFLLFSCTKGDFIYEEYTNLGKIEHMSLCHHNKNSFNCKVMTEKINTVMNLYRFPEKHLKLGDSIYTKVEYRTRSKIKSYCRNDVCQQHRVCYDMMPCS